MEFGLEKNAKIAFKRGKLVHSQNILIDSNGEIQELEEGKTCGFLGIEGSEGVQRQQVEGRLKQEYSRRLRMILKSDLNARNKITAIGVQAVRVEIVLL